jgi:energy-coupling factor transport system permease protein
MDSRGYGRTQRVPQGHRLLTGAVTLSGLLATAVGVYGVLDATTPAAMGIPTLVIGLSLSALGLWLGGRHVPRTTYRADPWRGAEWLTLGCGVVAATVLLAVSRRNPDVLTMPLTPLGVPPLPLAAVAGLLVGALPAYLTPEPPRAAPRTPQRAKRVEVVSARG